MVLGVMLGPLILLSLSVTLAIVPIWLNRRPKVQAARLLQRATGAMNSRRYDKALGYFDRADEMRDRIRKEKANDSVGFAIAQGRGICWFSKRRYQEAEKHFRLAVGLLNRGFEPEHRIVVFLYCNLASALLGQGKGSESEGVLSEAEEQCGQADNDKLAGVANLLVVAASGTAAHNQFDVAFRLARTAIEMLHRAELWHHGQLAEAQITLAGIHALVGEFRQARELVEQAIASAGKEQLDERVRDNAYLYLGGLSAISSDFPKAIEYLRQCIELRAEVHGSGHWLTSIAKTAMASVYAVQGDYRKAEEVFREAHTSQAKSLCEDDAILTSTGVLLARVLCDLGKYQEADRLLAMAEAVPVEIAIGNFNSLPVVRLVRGIWHLDQFQFEQAIVVLRESLWGATLLYGESSIMTADYREILGLALLRARSLQEAEMLLGETLAIREAAPDASALDFAQLLVSLAELYLTTGRHEAAEMAALRAREMIGDKVLPTNLTLAESQIMLAVAAVRRGAHAEAISHLREAEEIQLQVQQPNHPRVAYFCDAAVVVYQTTGDGAKEDHYRREGARIRSQYGEQGMGPA